MILAVDSSVVAAAILEQEPPHRACAKLMNDRRPAAWTHVIAETFSTLSGGRHGWRATPAMASQLIDEVLLPGLAFVDLSAREIGQALRQAQTSGVRGGAVYDFLHLAAARKAGAKAFYTLNYRHFIAVARSGDPEILVPQA